MGNIEFAIAGGATMTRVTGQRPDRLTSFAFTDDDFRFISAMLHEEAGIFLSDAKAPLVYSRLTKRLRTLGLESFREYCALLASDGGGTERQRMVAALTTNVTKFFREEHHFRHLEIQVFRRKLDALRAGARLRIWSAACSSGQEPYSIAMSALSEIGNASHLDIKILATDIDPNMVEAGRLGEYGEEVINHIPKDLVRRWFERRGDTWQVSHELASLIAFRELNLVGPWPMKGKFDAIFCRNVAIYFEERTQHTLWTRLASSLTHDGVLYIGHSERITGPAVALLSPDGVTTYRSRSATP